MACHGAADGRGLHMSNGNPVRRIDDPRSDPGSPVPGPDPAQGAPAGRYPVQSVYYQPQPAANSVAQAGAVAPAAAPTAASPAQTPPVAVGREEVAKVHPQVVVVAHSTLFYWWPVWAVGFVMAGLTWWNAQEVAVGESMIRMHPSNNLGVLFFLTVFLVVLISNVEVRGLASVVVILCVALAALVMAYYRVWDDVLGWFGDLNVYLNQGAYFWFSTLLFVTWALATFVFDRMNYWVIKPGQITRERFWGAGSESYDTENLTLEKRRDDLFRHWILGIGSGDLRVHTYGGQQKEIFIPNVLFVGFKVHAIQHLIAQEPAGFGHPAVRQ